MSEFLQNQLRKKVDKFFENRSDGFVVAINQWFSFGEGPLGGPPNPKYVCQEDFDYLVKEIIGEEALCNLLIEMKEKPEFFSILSGTEKWHIQNLNQMFMAEAYHALKKNVLKAEIDANNAIIKKKQKLITRLDKKIKELKKAEEHV